MGVSMRTVLVLRDAGHDTVHLRDLNMIQLPDPKIVELAAAQNRVVLTVEALGTGALVVVENDGYRIRRLPIQPPRRII